MSGVPREELSLYVPVRNAGRTLRAALDSIAEQTLRPAEVFLVVDFRSNDESVDVARHSGLRIVEQRDGRLGHARNLAIAACNTPWLASCDSDVTLEPGWLAALARRADRNVAMVGGRTNERIFTDGDRWRAVNLPHNWGPAAFDNPFMLVSEMLARVAAVRAIGGYRADLQSWEDSDCCQRLRQAGYTLRYEPGAVAWHDRRDSIEQVLDLRWFYASYRQRARLESLNGLIEKLGVNRAYCLQSLSQTMHGEYPQVSAASLMLWFHHLVRDLGEALRQWPMLADAERSHLTRAAQQTALSAIEPDWREALQPMSRILPRCLGEITSDTNDANCGVASSEPFGATSGFRGYLDCVRARTADLLGAIPPETRDLIMRSAAYLAGQTSEAWVPTDWQSTESDRRSLRSQPLEPAWHWPSLRARLESAGMGGFDDMTIVEWGRSVGVERPTLRGEDVCAAAGRAGTLPVERSPWSADSNADRLAILPHLECFSDARGTLRSALASAQVAIIGYRTPAVFLSAIPILTARDLASTCAAAGFAIREFQTDASRTVLVVESANRNTRDTATSEFANTQAG